MAALPDLRAFVAADVLLAGAVSPTAHPSVATLLTLSEVKLIDAVTSRLVVRDVTRALHRACPAAVPLFSALADRCVRVVPDPSAKELRVHRGEVDEPDLSALVCALTQGCPWLITLQPRHHAPGNLAVTVIRPGRFMNVIRQHLAALSPP